MSSRISGSTGEVNIQHTGVTSTVSFFSSSFFLFFSFSFFFLFFFFSFAKEVGDYVSSSVIRRSGSSQLMLEGDRS